MSKIFDAYKMKVGDSNDLAMEISRANSLEIFPNPAGRQLEEFNQLCNRLLGLRLEGGGSTVAFGSSSSGEGASFVSYNTAVLLATLYHQKVVWVDCNHLDPQKKLLGLDRVNLSSLLQKPDLVSDVNMDESPTLIPAGTNLMVSRGLFADVKYKVLLANLEAKFDFVILDLPPILSTNDTALIAKPTSGLLLVIEQKFLKHEVIDFGLTGLRDKGVNILGSVINRREFELPKFLYDRI